MTPDRWRQVDDLFDAALRREPEEREAWLREVCGDDEALRVEVHRLLSQDKRADRNGFLKPPEPSRRLATSTGSWPLRDNRGPSSRGPRAREGEGRSGEPVGFSRKAAIATTSDSHVAFDDPYLIRSALRTMPVIYILILAGALFWNHVVLGYSNTTLNALNAIVMVALAGVFALLSSRVVLSLAMLKVLDLGVTAMLASLFTYTQYRRMLDYSLHDDRMMAQLTMKNIVLLFSVLILTSGLHVPKSWGRAALTAGILAVLPFVTLTALVWLHPVEMAWLGKGWLKSQTARVFLFSFDAIILFVLATGSAFGARTISRLRRQVVEARRLGQYHLGRKLGAGGMGEVYLAEHQLLKRPCALKLIRAEGVADSRTLERFEREVRMTATLSHPNTVEIYDYGRTEDGTYYYVMEYLKGLSLEELVKQHGPLPAGRVVYLLRQVCLALREAHAANMIHRDIKPSNIFAARRGGMDDVAKLLDFGLVRPATAGAAPELSHEGEILGTPLFMSPEQATGGRDLDRRSDLYSLGAVAYYLLTGRPPFEGSARLAILVAHARDPVVPPSQIESGIPEDLEHVVLRCLSKVAADRFPDAQSLEHALGDCACTAEWDQGSAARWWAEAVRDPVPTA